MRKDPPPRAGPRRRWRPVSAVDAFLAEMFGEHVIDHRAVLVALGLAVGVDHAGNRGVESGRSLRASLLDQKIPRLRKNGLRCSPGWLLATGRGRRRRKMRRGRNRLVTWVRSAMSGSIRALLICQYHAGSYLAGPLILVCASAPPSAFNSPPVFTERGQDHSDNAAASAARGSGPLTRSRQQAQRQLTRSPPRAAPPLRPGSQPSRPGRPRPRSAAPEKPAAVQHKKGAKGVRKKMSPGGNPRAQHCGSLAGTGSRSRA